MRSFVVGQLSRRTMLGDLGPAHVLGIVVAHALDEVGWIFADFDLLRAERRGSASVRPVGVEAVEARRSAASIYLPSNSARSAKTICARLVMIVVLDERDVQQRSRIRFVGGRDGHCRPPPGSGAETVRSRLNGARVVDHGVLDLDELVVGDTARRALAGRASRTTCTMPTASSGATIRANVMPPALSAVISLSPESRWIASSVPSSSAIGITRTIVGRAATTERRASAAQSGA